MSNPAFTPHGSNNTSTANKSSLIVMGVLLALLLISNVVYYFIKKPVSAEHTTQQVATAVSVQKASFAELELRYQAANTQLDSLRVIIPSMEQKINQQQALLNQQRQQIEAKIESGDYAGAGLQIEELTRQKDAFIIEIARLRQDVTALRTEVTQVNTEKSQLQTENQTLSQHLETERQAATVLLTEKAELQTQRDEARNQVEAQTYLALSQVKAQPVKVSKKGKATPVKRHKDTEQIRICFQVPPSELIPNGQETFYIQVLNGQTTIGTDSRNSGTIRDKKTKQEFAYTTRMECPYKGTTSEFYGSWTPTSPLPKGTYRIIVWHRGRQVGSDSFNLK